MFPSVRARSRRVRRTRLTQAVVAFVLLLAPVVGFSALQGGGSASAAIAIAQTYYTPFEAQQFIDTLRTLNGNSGCCTSPVISTIAITSGADGNIIYYDHFEDGYEADPVNPVQASTLTLLMDSGDAWSQTSSVPVDDGGIGGGRGAGNYFDGRDRISSTHPIAVTQSGYASSAGPLLASDAAVLDLDKSGLRYDIPGGQNADYNQLFQYTGLVIVSTADATTVDLDLDANGSFESTVVLAEGETHVVNGGVMLGAAVQADKRVSVYVTTGDVGSNYESRFFELYPTEIWANSYVSPVGSVSGQSGTRVFLFNPGAAAIAIDVVAGSGATATINLAARGSGSYLMPVDAGAEFTSQGGEQFYAFQMSTTEGSDTSSWDWGFTLVPGQAVTPSVIIPYGAGSQGLTNNYSPVWVAATGDTTLYVDRDGDPATGALIDAYGNHYDFTCSIGAFDSTTVYDDGTSNCYLPSQTSAAGGDRDMTGARLYTLDGTGLVAAWGQRPGYAAGLPALDMGTAILPFPVMVLTKGAVLSVDSDSDGLADGGDEITYTITMQNLGIIDVSNVTLLDETPANTNYLAGSTSLDGIPQPDDPGPFSASPLDADSPTGSLFVGIIDAGTSRVVEVTLVVDTPIPFGVSQVANVATMATPYGPTTTINRFPVDVPPLQIMKSSSPSDSPVGSGDTITYTVAVANADDITQTGIEVLDVLPAGTTYVPGSVSADIDGAPFGAGDPPTLASGVTLDPDQVLTVTFDVVVDAPMAAGTLSFVNTASASSDQNPTPVSDDATDPAGPLADLSLTKSDDEVAPLHPGDQLLYTIAVTNSGPDEASGVLVTDTLPAGATFVPAASSPSCAEGPAGTISCSIGDLGLTTASLDIAVTIDAATADTTIINSATVTSSTPEASPGDETDTEDTAVDVIPTITVSKTPSPTTLGEPGGIVTFTVAVTNTSAEPLTLVSLTDDVFGDLRDAGNAAVSANTCAVAAAGIAAGGTLTCSFDAVVAGSAGGPDHLDTVTATVADDEDNRATGEASAYVGFVDVLPVLGVSKTPSVASVPEPGDTVTFDVTIRNDSAESVTLVTLADDVFGDLLDAGNAAVSANTCPVLPVTLAPGAAFGCSFDAFVAGNGSDPDHQNTITFEASDDDGNAGSAQAGATVGFDDVAPSVTVTKEADPGTITEPGGTVTFTVTIDNLGFEPLTIDSLIDDVFGDLRDAGNPAITANTCPALSGQVAAGGWVACWFDADLAGVYGDSDHVDTVTVTLSDDDGTTITASDDASVAFAPANSTVGGIVFTDLDRDGTRDVGEPVLVGVDVIVTGSGGGSTLVTTAGDGTWTLAVRPGATALAVDPATVPAGYTLTTANASQLLTARMGEHVAAGEVGYGPQLGSISGMLFLDLDGDPTHDVFEPALSGLSVELRSGATVVDTTTSAGNGSYSFTDLPAGSYTVRVVPATIPAGLTSSVDPDGGSDGSAITAVVAAVTTSDQDFGHRGTATIGDTVWLDDNEDGYVDEFEEPISGAEISLRWWGLDGIAGNGDDYEFAPQTSDSNGFYLFQSLPPGTYSLEVDTSGVGSELSPTTPETVTATLSPGQANASADFGFSSEELPYTGFDAEDLILVAAMMIALGAVVFADGRKRERRYRIATWRIDH